jgi:DNA topoisomerase-3
VKVIIAEKPSVAREIARVFGATNKKDGYIEGQGFTFTWAFGHLLQLASPQEYGYYGWDSRNLPMLPGKFKLSIRQVKTATGFGDDPKVVKQLNTIKNPLRRSD